MIFRLSRNRYLNRTFSLLRPMTLKASPLANRGYEHSEHPRIVK